MGNTQDIIWMHYNPYCGQALVIYEHWYGLLKNQLKGHLAFPLSVSQSVQLLSHVRLFVTPWTAACQASLSITNCWSPPKLMSVELVISSSHLILCRPRLLLPSIFPRNWVFSNESALCISLFTFMHWRRKWRPTPVFLPGESQGQESLVGCCLWGSHESDTTEVTVSHSVMSDFLWPHGL